VLLEKREALGRSRGGYSTKIHASVDGLGNPLELRITGGERNDITQAEELIENWQEEDTKVIGDKGYDANKLIEKIGESKAVIPSKRNRKKQRNYDKHLYKERHLIECFFHKLKQYRHVFSRFDKLARNFLSFLYFVCTLPPPSNSNIPNHHPHQERRMALPPSTRHTSILKTSFWVCQAIGDAIHFFFVIPVTYSVPVHLVSWYHKGVKNRLR